MPCRDGHLCHHCPDQDPLFQAHICDHISNYWIPFAEILDIANGRKAIWNQKKSVIMSKGDDVGKLGE